MSWLGLLLEENSPDPRARIDLGQKILAGLSDQRFPSDPRTIMEFCDVLFLWISASNYKVSVVALEVMDASLDVAGELLAPYIQERIPQLIERLGDNKQPVRDAATNILLHLANLRHSSPSTVLERLSAGFGHRGASVKAGTIVTYRLLVEQFSEDLETQTYRLIPILCKLLSDPTVEVRDNSLNCLVHMCLVYGREILFSIKNRHLLTDNKLQTLLDRYEACSRTGVVPGLSRPAVAKPPISSPSNAHTPPRSAQSPAPRNGMAFRAPLPPYQSNKANNFEADNEQENRGTSLVNSRGTPMSTKKRVISATPSKGSAASSGAVTEEDFQKQFRTVPKCEIYTVKEMNQQLETIRMTLEKTDNDWSKRVNSLKLLRSVLVHGGRDFEAELVTGINSLEEALLVSVKDLRSQVCREACVTICFLCEELEGRMFRVCEAVLPAAMQLVPSSTKVMASSGALLTQFIIKDVENPKLIPLVLAYVNNKGKEVRRQTQAMINLILSHWGQDKLHKFLNPIVDAVKTGLCDADSMVRQNARNCYNQLDNLYPQQAAALYKALDPSRQKQLNGATSAASSSHSITSLRDSAPMTHRPGVMGTSTLRKNQNMFLSGRSASAIDATSAKKVVAASPRRFGPSVTSSGYGMQRTPTVGVRPNVVRGGPGYQAASRPSSLRQAPPSPGISSQPGSRSNSPTRGSTNRRLPTGPGTMNRRPSQEPSPNRLPLTGRGSNGFANGGEQQQLFQAIKNFSTSRKYEDDEMMLQDMVFTLPAELNVALRNCLSSNVAEKKEGIRTVQDAIRSGRRLAASDIKHIGDTVVKLLADGNHKVGGQVLDLLADLVRTHGSGLVEQLPLMLRHLLARCSAEIIPTASQHIFSTLTTLRESFDPNVQLSVICRQICDPVYRPTIKIRIVTLTYMHDLLSSMEQADLSGEEIRQMVTRLFQWMEDPKQSQLKPGCEKVLRSLFSVNAADFTAIIGRLTPEWKEYAYALLQQQQQQQQQHHEQQQYGHNVENQVSRSPVVSSSKPSTPPTNLYRKPKVSLGELRGNDNSPNLNGSGSVGYQQKSKEIDLSSLSDQLNSAQLEETMAFAHDTAAQRNYVAGLINVLQSVPHDPERQDEQVRALLTLQKMITEGSFTLFDEFFKSILVSIFGVLTYKDVVLKRHGLRLLSKLCSAQASCFYDMAEMCVLKVLDCLAGEESVTVGDETMTTLATHLPLHVVLRTLNSIIADQTDGKLANALKMLTRLFEVMQAEEILPLIPDVAPGVAVCVNHPVSAVRKNTVFCLVQLVNKLGREPLNPYLQDIPQRKLNLLNIYVQRQQTSSTNF